MPPSEVALAFDGRRRQNAETGFEKPPRGDSVSAMRKTRADAAPADANEAIEPGCVVLRMRRVARVLTRLYDDALAPTGLTAVQFGTLGTLASMGPSALAQIAEATGHERTVTWRGLQPLIQRGLVRRVEGSGRAGRYEISAAGTELHDIAHRHWQAVQDRVLAALGQDVDGLTAKVAALGER